MGVFIITLAILSLCAYVFKLFWKDVLRFCFHLLAKAFDVVSNVITATRRFGKAVMYLYRRWRDGRITRSEVDEEIDVELLPKGLREEFNVHDEVVVHKGDISPEEF